MKANMGSADKVIKVILAIVFGVLYFTAAVTGTAGIVLLVFGGVFLFTSFTSYFLLYAPFDLSNASAKKSLITDYSGKRI